MNKSIVFSALAAQLAVGANVPTEAKQGFSATHVRHSGEVHVQARPEQAFQLFTAPGEKLWAPGWDPVVLSGGDGRRVGSVWVTTNGGEKTIWVVVDFDDQALHARYARITPESRAGTVVVKVLGDGKDGSIAEVSYELTALTEAGNRHLAEFGGAQFARMMSEWEELIRTSDIDYAALAGQ